MLNISVVKFCNNIGLIAKNMATRL